MMKLHLLAVLAMCAAGAAVTQAAATDEDKSIPKWRQVREKYGRSNEAASAWNVETNSQASNVRGSTRKSLDRSRLQQIKEYQRRRRAAQSGSNSGGSAQKVSVHTISGSASNSGSASAPSPVRAPTPDDNEQPSANNAPSPSTNSPTQANVPSPTDAPTTSPVETPTLDTQQPSITVFPAPSARPSSRPSKRPSAKPSSMPSEQPTVGDIDTQQPLLPNDETEAPFATLGGPEPTPGPTRVENIQPQITPAPKETKAPKSDRPNPVSTSSPTKAPKTNSPTLIPTLPPTPLPTNLPTQATTTRPSKAPKTARPTPLPSPRPTPLPTAAPTQALAASPSKAPKTARVTPLPSPRPTSLPTSGSTPAPTEQPTSASATPRPSPVPTPEYTLPFIPLEPTLNIVPQTVSPTNVPSEGPTPKPTTVPTGVPATLSPTKLPTAKLVPQTLAPAVSPTASTDLPTSLLVPQTGAQAQTPTGLSPELPTSFMTPQTLAPAETPSSSVSEETCSYSWIYCGAAMSTCFDSYPGVMAPDAASGWVINLTDYDFGASGPLECEVWGGATSCTMDEGELLGTATIDSDTVTWYIKKGYASMGFQLYAGECVMNDNGGSWLNDMECGSYQYAPYDIYNYPVSTPLDIKSATNRWLYDFNNQETYTTAAWASATTKYETFPLDTHTPLYLSGHAQICAYTPQQPTTAPLAEQGGAEPTSLVVPNPATVIAPMNAPVAVPTGTPTTSPSTPRRTMRPRTGAPTGRATPLPTPSTTSRPTAKPSLAMTSAPSASLGAVTRSPVNQIVAAPAAAPVEAPSECVCVCPTTPAPTPFFIEQGTPEPSSKPVPDATSTPTIAPAPLPTTPEVTATPTMYNVPETVKPTSAPVTASPVSAAPVSLAPVSIDPVSAAPVSAAPVSAAPASAAPVSAAPASAAPVSAAPVSAAPASAAPVSAAPASAAPVSAAPVSAAPVSAAPVSKAPISAAPASAAPVSAAPVSASPVSKAPVAVAAPTEVPTTLLVTEETPVPSSDPLTDDCPPSQHTEIPATTVSPATTTPTTVSTANPPFGGDGDGDLTASPTSALPLTTLVPTKLAAINDDVVGVPTSSTPSPCMDAYVKCADRSTCFLDSSFNCIAGVDGQEPWGWNIEYSSVDGVVDDCEVFIEAENCEGGTKIGTATITPSSFSVTLLAPYSSDAYTFEFNFYAGECIGNDSGDHLDTGVCLADDVAKFARDPDTYPLTSGPQSSNTFTFNSSNTVRSNWGPVYEVFPLGTDDRKYLSGQVEICPL
ncbi:hypothetical protein MPSEU_000745600 [Mayamaea pseudoterrestris]|nr:hypothetical protein MPSEU_000745600 [Mayamaea pseudoterrestris]